jgi:hypothetical protein
MAIPSSPQLPEEAGGRRQEAGGSERRVAMAIKKALVVDSGSWQEEE